MMKNFPHYFALLICAQLNAFSQETVRVSSVDDRFNGTGGNGELEIYAYPNLRWKAESNVPWIKINDSEWKQGINTISYSIESNETTDSRTGKINVNHGSLEYNWEEVSTIATDCNNGSQSLEFSSSTGSIFVAYGDGKNILAQRGKLTLLIKSPNLEAWESLVLDPQCIAASTSLGFYNGFVAVAYNDEITNSVKFTYYDKEKEYFVREVVAQAQATNVQIRTDPNGIPMIAYYDQSDGKIKFALRENGEWMTEDVASVGDHHPRAQVLKLNFTGGLRNLPLITFYDLNERKIKTAVKKDNTWIFSEVINYPSDQAIFDFTYRLGDNPRMATYGREDEKFTLEFYEFKNGVWHKQIVDYLDNLFITSRICLSVNSSGYQYITYQWVNADSVGFQKIALFDGEKWNLSKISDEGNLGFGMQCKQARYEKPQDVNGVGSFERPVVISATSSNTLKFTQARKNDLSKTITPIEISINQKPKDSDSDGDGFSDSDEEGYGSNPLDKDSFPLTFNSAQSVVNSFGGDGSLTVNAPSKSNWSVVSSSPWIKIPDRSTITGDGSIAYSIDPNFTERSRRGLIKISEGDFTQEWTSEVIENLGEFSTDAHLATSLSHNNLGFPAVAYFDYGEEAIKYAEYDGDTWWIEKVDTVGPSDGYFTISLSHSPSGEPSIAYFDNRSKDLKYATRMDGQWNLEVIIPTRIGGRYYTVSLAHYANGNPVIAYHDNSTSPASSLTIAEKNNNEWLIRVIDKGEAGSVGAYTSLALDDFDNPGIAYFNNSGYNVRFAKREGSSWSIQTADPKNTTGVYNSLDFKPDGNPAIAYKDYRTENDVRYAVYQNDSWNIQTVAARNNVGSYLSLDHDSDGNAAISYSDKTDNNLYCSVYDGVNWNQFQVDEEGIHPKHTSLEFDRKNAIHISYISYSDGNLRFAEYKSTKAVYHFIEQEPGDPDRDSDGDGLKDIVETNTGVFQSMEDTGTDPLKIDSDNDGVSDSSELGLDRFSLVVGSRTWREAFDDAILKGGNLGTFTTEHEMDNALSSVDFNSLKEFRGVWIGATDAEEEGNWKWVTGEDLELGRWAANHPDNFLEADVAEIGAGLSNEPGKIFDVPESVSRDAYLLEVGYPSNPLNPDTDSDGFTDGEEARASTRPDDADDKPEPSPILDNIEFTIIENQDNKELLSLNPSHPNGDEVTVEIFDNPDVDQDGVGAFGIVNNKLQINDFDDFDFELQTSLQLTLRLRSDKAIPVDSLVTIQLIDDRDEDFDGDGIIESVEEDVHGTSDTSVDSDNDGLSDAFEIGYGRFEIVKGSFSWSAAISDAASRGGHLATFPSQSKWDVAIDSLGEKPFQNFNKIWIGLLNEGKWSWADGSDLTYERWGTPRIIGFTRAFVSGVAGGRTAGAWYTAGANSVTDGYFLELGYPTDPSRADTDNDGVDDKDEIDSGTNPVVADDFFVGDSDRDGWKDEAERLFGSNPEDPESVPDFQLQVEVDDSNEIELLFPGEKGESYQIQFSENLEEWISLEGLMLGSGATIRQVVPMRDNFPFYRIKRN
ncbi:hypothetical protein OAG38_02430 [Akkermansiaceae bacterium]|nr:hypothetical protein [Akkermansiaceae bacterium]